MFRKKMIAGNWKMNGLLKDGVCLAKDIAEATKKIKKPACKILVCPPFTLLTTVKKALRGSVVELGAQDCALAPKGAHTGDISPEMLKDAGCSYVILGHSERRTDHAEISKTVRHKAEAAYRAGLKVIICVGETEEQRNSGDAFDVCRRQVRASLPAKATSTNTVIAYEPVWAIGTGKTPTPADVQEMHEEIRIAVASKIGKRNAYNMHILYGGSMKPSNAEELLKLKDVDGGLIGGASLKAADFMDIIKLTSKK